MNLKKQAFAALIPILLLGSLFPAASAQSVDSSVQGTVADTSGAVVPEAEVRLTNVRTGVALRTESDSAGNYVFPAVSPGVYSLEVSRQGFANYALSQFNVIVGQHATENATLSIASAAQTVTVQANGLANLLETQSNDLGNVIGPQSVAQLPLNGRNFLQLGLLSGATQTNQGAGNASIAQTGHPGMSINIAGNEPDFTMYMVNGIQTIGTRAGNTSLNLSMSAIDQFEVHYGFFMPDMGTNPGIVDVVTKSGTNQIHGEAYEYVRNNQMEARDYFSKTAPGPYHQNQFGASMGGPILKTKLFYFGNYEGYRQIQSKFQSAFTPTQAMFGGDFSALSTPVYDPTTYNAATGQRQQFQGNVIPSNRINNTAKQLLAFYLPGSSATGSSNVSGNPATTLNSDQITARVDYNLNERNQFFGQGSWLNAPDKQPGLFPSQGTAYPLNTEFTDLGWTWTLSPTKVNSLRLGVVRDEVYDQGVSVPGIQTKLGITGTGDADGVPGISIAGYTGFGTSTGLLGDIDNVYQIHESFNWLHGNHQIKMGGDLAYTRSVQSSANGNARGIFNFNNVFSAQTKLNANGTVSQVAGTGNAFADFLLGDLTTAQSIAMPKTHYRWTTFEPYIQDTWKLSRSLNANLALAWFANTPPNPPDKINRDLIHGFDFKTGLETFAALGTANPEVFSMTLDNFAPRIGLTWQPWFDRDMVVRAGWGMYYTTQMDITAQYSVVSQYISVNNQVSNATSSPNPTYVLGVNAMPPVTVGQITAAEVPTITGAIQYLAADQHSPGISQWNLDIQHTFGKAYMLDVAYIGNEAHHLQKNWNPWDGSSPGVQTYNLAQNPWYPKYSYMQEVDNIGNGSYNALLVKFQRQFTHGLSILANYTWQKSLSDATEGSNGTLNQDKSCFRCDWGPTTSNVPQSLVISAVADVPVGRGRYIGRDMNRILDGVIGGWNVDAIVTMQKGNPFSVSAPNNTNWSPANIKADRYCNGRNELQNKNLRSNGMYWIYTGTVAAVNSPCFVNPATDPHNTSGSAWYFGTSGFDILTGPGINNWDMGVHKTFPIHDTVQFVVRGEFFNAWNHPQFANPSNGVTATNFGVVTATNAGIGRIAQLGANLSF
ncbi:MAG TPA: carboxypeptidase-like regulatory domain-containing protein [Terracidiphilus sp.]|nr:carboxypeptidase-like regulatory domain-containing protein [Terracidiphilus sp.]